MQAARQLIDRFCGGSVEEFLVGLVDNQVLEPGQLQRLAEKIALRTSRNEMATGFHGPFDGLSIIRLTRRPAP